ncbi:MAG: hypothetical protein EBR07_00210 [Planctomycetes bacterium]|nr:hypothetical protein [Planctomycetota bacterium]
MKHTEIRTFLRSIVRFRKPVVQMCYADLDQVDDQISFPAKIADSTGSPKWLLDVNRRRISVARTFLQSLPFLSAPFSLNFTTMVA